MRLIRRPAPPPIVPIHDRALQDLGHIRAAMDRAASFSALPGWWMASMGLLSDRVRLPLVPATPEARAAVESALGRARGADERARSEA